MAQTTELAARGPALPAAHLALPSLLAEGRRLVFLLDYDGTLAAGPPLPSTLRFPSPRMVAALNALHDAGALLGIVTGRGEANLLHVLPSAARFTVASSHGLRIRCGDAASPGFKGGVEESNMNLVIGGEESLVAVHAAYAQATSKLAALGLDVRVNDEAHFFSFQVADCSETDRSRVRAIAEEVVAAAAIGAPASMPEPLHVRELKGVIEVRPHAAMGWNKGSATAHLLQAAGLTGATNVSVVAIGDDVSDEAMFAAALGAGCGAAAAIVVGVPGWPTRATYTVADHAEVEEFLSEAAAAVCALGPRV